MRPGRRERSRLRPVGELRALTDRSAALTLYVPARPEALSIVRLVVMSCGAAGGLALEEIFERSHEVAGAFADLLIKQPQATTIVVRTRPSTSDVDLRTIGNPNGRREA